MYEEYQDLENTYLTLFEINANIEGHDNSEQSQESSLCCNGKCQKHKKIQNLYCFLDTKTSNALIIAPVKKEILSLDPYIALFHDVITLKEQKILQSVSKKHLMSSTTVDGSGVMLVKDYRISKSVWFERDYNNITKRLTMFIEHATGFDMNSSELFQVINYGLGGRFECHEDYLLTDKVCLKN